MKRNGLLFIPILLVILLIPSSVLAQGGSYTITVIGEGTASGKPDEIAFEVGVEAVNSDSITAYNQVVTQLEGVRAGLLEVDIAPDDIELLRITFTPQDRIDAGQAPTGEFLFRAQGYLHVVVRDTSNLELILATAVRTGATSIQNFTFGFKDTMLIEEKARAAAIANAYERADQTATAMAVAVGDPIVIMEESVDISFASDQAASAGTEINISSFSLKAGEVTITVTVQITFALRSSR
jgi:uncharacterized protein YggE